MIELMDTTLREEFEIIMGQSPSSKYYNEDGEGLPFFQGKKEFRAVYPDIEKWTTQATKKANKGDVLLSVRAPVGAVNIAPENCGIGRGLAAIKPNEITSNKFIFYLIKSKENELKKRGAGVTFSAITKPNLYSFPIRIPKGKKNRTQVVDSIETQFTRLDSTINSLRTIKNKLAFYRRSVLKAGFEPFADNLDKFTNCVEILDSKRIPINRSEREKRKGNVPYYGATGQVGWIDNYLFNEELVLLGEDGAPFLDSSKCKAYLIDGKSWVNNHAHVLKGKNGLKNKFLVYWLNNIDYRLYVGGTTRLKLNQNKMKNIPIPRTPEDNQNLVVDFIESRFSVIDKISKVVKKSLLKAERLRRSILKAAFEGKLVN